MNTETLAEIEWMSWNIYAVITVVFMCSHFCYFPELAQDLFKTGLPALASCTVSCTQRG